MKKATIVYLLRPEEVLMALKQKVLGINKWFGYGGKIEDYETALECACRETREESRGLIIEEKDLSPVALIDFYNGPDRPFGDPNFRVIFYTAKIWQGEPQDTDEMKCPTWFSIKDLPFHEMKAGDELIIPQVTKEIPQKGYIRFSEDESLVIDFKIEPCDIHSLVI